MKILIVDDSALMRRHLSLLFEKDGGFEVRLARNGEEAVKENLEFEPDVITLDINMPEMDGLTALSQIMLTRRVPVVMVSSLTEKGAMATFEALALGAIDYVAKPDGTISGTIQKIEKEILRKVKIAARANVREKNQPENILSNEGERRKVLKHRIVHTNESGKIVIIGVSTGGPSTLDRILPEIPGNFPAPIVIAQHMPPFFTGPFAKRLDGICNLTVTEVTKPMELQDGNIYIGKGGTDIIFGDRSGRSFVMPKPESPEFHWHPSVELLGRTALDHYKADKIVGVMLTGMGNDGAVSFSEIKKKGGKTIAESEETAVVFGMPKELIAQKGASITLPSYKVGAQIKRWIL